MPGKKINLDFDTWGDDSKQTAADSPLHSPGPETADASIKAENTAIAEVVDETPFDQFDLERAQGEKTFLVIKTKIGKMLEKAKTLTVKDEDGRVLAMQMRVQIKALLKSSDDSLKGYQAYKAASMFKLGMDKFFRENIKQKLTAIDNIVSPRLNAYNKSQAELQRRIDKKKADDEAERVRLETKKSVEDEKARQEKEHQEALDLQAEMNLKADNEDVDRVQLDIPIVQTEDEIKAEMPEIPVTPKSEKVDTAHGSATVKPVWKCTVINPGEVPRSFCVPDQKLLDAAVEAGVHDIPGCKIEEVFETKIRLSRSRKDADIVF